MSTRSVTKSKVQAANRGLLALCTHLVGQIGDSHAEGVLVGHADISVSECRVEGMFVVEIVGVGRVRGYLSGNEVTKVWWQGSSKDRRRLPQRNTSTQTWSASRTLPRPCAVLAPFPLRLPHSLTHPIMPSA